jgi:hypothetical protein
MGYKLTWVYIRPNGTEKQIRPTRFIPWVNTVLYCPLEDDILDHSGNHTMTLTTSSYGTVAKDSTWFYYFNGGYITSENYTWPNEVTVSMWLKKETKHTSEAWCWAFSGHYKSSHPYHYFAIDTWNSDNTHNAEFIIYNGSARSVTTNAITEWVWTHVALTYSATTWLTAYVNGVSVGTYATTWNITSYSWPTNIWATFAYTNQFYEGYISEVIVESVPRTAQEVTDYYNLTKWNYGL